MEPPDWPNRSSGAKFNCCLFICLLYFNDLGFILNGDGKGINWLRGAIKLSFFHLLLTVISRSFDIEIGQLIFFLAQELNRVFNKLR